MKLPNGRDLRDYIKNGNWGLKLLALLLAIVIYLAIRTETSSRSTHVIRMPHEIILNDAAAPREKTALEKIMEKTSETKTEKTTSNDGTTNKPK